MSRFDGAKADGYGTLCSCQQSKSDSTVEHTKGTCSPADTLFFLLLWRFHAAGGGCQFQSGDMGLAHSITAAYAAQVGQPPARGA